MSRRTPSLKCRIQASALASLPAVRFVAIMHLAEVGGPAQHIHPWLEALAERGQLEVVVPGAGRTAEVYAPLARTTVLPYEPLTFPTSLLDVVRLTRQLVGEVRSFRRHLRQARPDVVVVVTTVLPAAVLAARLEGIPTVVYAAEIFDKGFLRTRMRLLAGTAVARLTQRLADAVVCCSNTVAEQFERNGRALVATAFPGVDPPDLAGRPARLREAHGLSGPGPYLAVLGNITPGRGQDLAIRALALLRRDFPHIRCLIAGIPLQRRVDLAYRDELLRLTDTLGLADHVVFTGFVEPVADVYAAADIVVNPARFNEPFGRVALEALVAGKPVVATRAGAIPEVLRDGQDALLVEPEDPEALASAVARMWKEPELRERLIASGRERALGEYSARRGAETFMTLVDEVMEKAGHPGDLDEDR